MFLVETFGEWLTAQIKLKGWKQAELARRAHIKDATLSRIITGTRQVGPDVALSIARALDIPADKLFRRAGFLPAEAEKVEEEKDLVEIFRELRPPLVRHTVLTMLRGLARRPAIVEQRALYGDPAIDELVDIYRRLDAIWQPELLEAARMVERNAHAGEPRIIGGDDDQPQPPSLADP